MKKFALLTCVGVLGFLFASAAGPEPGEGKGKKDDVNGSVTHADTKKPLKDVSITAYSTTKKEKVIITNDGGYFAFEDLKPGTYKFVFEKDGFKKVVKEKIIARADEAFQMNIEMIEVEEFNIVPSRFFSN